MRHVSILSAVVLLATLMATQPAQGKTYPHVLEIASVSLPGSEHLSTPESVVVEVRYEVRSVMVRGRSYYIFLSARPDSPTRTGSFVIPKTRDALRRIHGRKGTVRLSVPVNSFVEASAGTEPLILWVSLVERWEEDSDRRHLGHPLARSKPVALFLAK